MSGAAGNIASSRRRWWIGLLLLPVLVTAVYWPSVDGDFVFDDRKLVLENYELWEGAGFDLNVFRDRSLDPVRTNYRPLRFLSYKLDAVLTGMFCKPGPDGVPSPFFFHLQNILLHGLNAILVALLARRLIPRAPDWVPLILGAAFALHPIQTESVAYISGRRDVLFATFYLLALLFYLRRRPNRGWITALGTTGLYLCALLAKEMAITLPAALVAVELLAPSSEGTESRSSRFRWADLPWRPLVLQGALACGFVFVLLSVGKPGAGTPYWGGDAVSAFWTSARAQAHYIGLLLWPFQGLTIDYSFNAFPASKGPFDPIGGALALALIVGLLGVAGWAWRRGNRWVAVGLPLYFATLTPVAQILPHPERMAERFLYLPWLVGLMVLVGFLGPRLWRYRAAAGVAVGAVLVLWTYATLARLPDWQGPYPLWKSSVRMHPECARSQFGLGNAARRQGRVAEAADALARAIELLKDQPRDRLQQGYYLQALLFRADLLGASRTPEDRQGAIEHYVALLEETDTDGHPVAQDPVVLDGLRKVQRSLSLYADARATAQRIVDLPEPEAGSSRLRGAPQRLEALFHLSAEAQKEKDFSKARKFLDQAEAWASTDRERGRVFYEVGVLWQLEKQWTKARVAFQKATELFRAGGRWSTAAYLAAECLVHQGRLSSAAEELRALVAEEPGHLAATLSLADLELGLSNLEAAEYAYRSILQVAPQNERAREGLRAVRIRREYTEQKPARPADAGRARVLKMLGEKLIGEKEYEKAVDAFRKADDNADGPDQRELRAEIRLQLARCEAQRKKWPEASAAYDGYLQIIPLADRDADAVLEAAEALVQLSKFEKAYALLVEHDAAGMKHPSLHKNLGAIAIHLRNRDGALRWYRRALEPDELPASERERLQSIVDMLEAMPESSDTDEGGG